MNKEPKHIIHKQIMQLTCNNTALGSQLHKSITSSFQDKLAPLFSEVFTEYSQDELYLLIDRLEVDLGVIPIADFENEFISRLKKTLRNSIRRLAAHRTSDLITNPEDLNTPAKDRNLVKLNKAEALKTIFFQYLIAGTFPVWYSEGSIQNLETEIPAGNIFTEADINRIAEITEKYHYIPQRLAYQFSPAFLDYLFKTKKSWNKIYDESGIKKLRLFLETELSKGSSETKRMWLHLFNESLMRYLFKTNDSSQPIPVKYFLDTFIAALPLSIKQEFIAALSSFNHKVSSEFKTKYNPLSREIIVITNHYLGNAKTDSGISEKQKLQQQTQVENKPVDNLNSENIGLSDSKAKESKLWSDAKETPTEAGAPELIINELDSQTEGLKRYTQSFFKTIPDDNSNYYYINNAGLVLLAPYIQMFFKELNLLTPQNQFNNEYMVHKGIIMLHYLCFKTMEAEENNLVFNKLLCGVPVEFPVPAIINFTEQEKGEAENLLNAVIRNWKSLKSTSADGLRDGFLQRAGKLTFTEQGWKLKVEQKTMDILLNSLPWSYSIIKLPWMKHFLLTEWN